jgi:hypothetical protein
MPTRYKSHTTAALRSPFIQDVTCNRNMKTTAFVLLLLFMSSIAYGQEDKIEESWVKEDSVFISNYIKSIKVNALDIEKYLQPNQKWKNDLGFGYASIEGSMGKGYVTVFYQLIYYKDKLVSYKLHPQMPSDARLTGRYKQFYSSLYQFDGSDQIKTHYYNLEEMAKPLNGNQGKISSAPIFLMTPFSGTVYGYTGDIASSVLPNREAYNSVRERLTPEDYLALLYSKNPATRLTAIEEYYRNTAKFIKYKAEIENRIKIIFKELPEMRTMYGCILTTDNSEKLVSIYLKEIKNYSK